MTNKLSKAINQHHYSKIYYSFPWLLRLQHIVNFIITLRVWYVNRSIKKILKKTKQPFTYVDAGCGPGDFIIPLLHKYNSSKFIGVDKNFNNVKICSAYSQRYNYRNAEFVCGNIEELKLKQKLDIISCISVLQYVINDERALKNFYNSLTDGGCLILYVPINFNRMLPFFNMLKEKLFKDVEYDVEQSLQRKYTSEEIISKLKASGFHITNIEYAYSGVAQIAFEIKYLLIYSIQKLPSILAVIPLLLFIIFSPVMIFLMYIDYIKENNNGNGMMVVAQKDAYNKNDN